MLVAQGNLRAERVFCYAVSGEALVGGMRPHGTSCHLRQWGMGDGLGWSVGNAMYLLGRWKKGEVGEAGLGRGFLYKSGGAGRASCGVFVLCRAGV